MINATDLGRLNWKNYDVMIIPDGNYHALGDKAILEEMHTWVKDTMSYHHDYFGLPKLKPKKKVVVTAPKKVKVDSIFYTPKVTLDDTTRVRMIMAFHSAKIFKSDLQAKADSIFYIIARTEAEGRRT